MPKILSISSNGSTKNPFKSLFNVFESFDSFTKVIIVTCLLIVIATPFIVGNRQIFTPKAEEAKEDAVLGPQQAQFLSNEILIKVKRETKANIKESKDDTGLASLDKKFKEHKVKKFEKIAKEGKNSQKDADIFQWYKIGLDREAKTLKAKATKGEDGPDAEDPETQDLLNIVEQFKQDPSIEEAEPNFIVSAFQTPSPTPIASRVFVTSVMYLT